MTRWLLTLALLCLPSTSWAAIAYVSVTNSAADTTSATSLTTSVTVPTGSDRLMVVTVQSRGSTTGSAVSGVTFNGSEVCTLAKAQTHSTSPRFHSSIWYCVGPSVTTANVVVSWPDALNNQTQGYSVVLLTGVSQTSPLDATSGVGGSGTALSTTITTVADNAFIVDSATARADTVMTVGAGQTSRASRLLNTPGTKDPMGVSTTAKTPAGAEAMNWTQLVAQEWVMTAASFAPATAAPPPDPPATATNATITWTNGTDAVGVTSATLKRCTIVSPATSCTPVSVLTTVLASNGSAGTYVDQTLVSGVAYNWCVSNNDDAANQSTCTLATTGATGGTIYRNTLATVSWTAVANGADIGADWTDSYTGAGPAKIVSGRVLPTTLGTDAMERYDPITPADDQWCQVTIGAFGGAQSLEQGCVLRMPAGPTQGYYVFTTKINSGSGFTSMIADYDGTPASIATESATVWAVGDKLRGEAQGTSLKLYRVVGTTETLLISTTDSAHTGGKAGIYVWVTAAGTLTNNQIYDFAMGEFSLTPPVPPSIATAAVDINGATLTYGATTPTTIRVHAGNNGGTSLNVVEPISAFPAGRYTRTWQNGLTFVCFHAIDALGVETTLPTSAFQCKSLVGVVGSLDTTPPVLSSCQPNATLPFGTTSTILSCVMDKPATCRYDSTDLAYADMTGTDMIGQSLTCSVTVTGLTNGSTTTKYVRAQSVDELGGEYPTTTSQTVTIAVLSGAGADTTAPSTVTGLVATPVSNSQALLVWTAATDNVAVASYIIYQSTDACVTKTIGGLTTLTSRTLTNLTPGTAYCWTVKAQDTSFNQSAAFSNQASLTTGVFLDVEPPATPGALSASLITTTSLLLNIPAGSDNIGITATTIERCTGLGCNDLRVLMTIPGAFPIAITDLQPSTSYTFRIKYADAAGNASGYSPLFLVTSASQTGEVMGYCHCHLHH